MEPPVPSRPTPWTTVIVVCSKCSRRLDGGYGAKRRLSLRSALNDALRTLGLRRRVRVMETKCFGICPKKAVVALNASRPDRLFNIPRGTEAVVALEELGAVTDNPDGVRPN